MGKLRSYQEQVQKFLEQGIDTAELRHKRLVTRPFDFAEKIEKEAKSYSFKSVRQAHNHYAKSVYSSLRSLNERANGYASDLIGRLEKEEAKSAKSESAASVQKPAAKKSNGRSKPATAKKSTVTQDAGSQSSTASA
jgi:hypothetical protein